MKKFKKSNITQDNDTALYTAFLSGRSKERFPIAKISGDCMMPTLHPGDIIAADRNQKNIIDGLYLLNFNGKTVVLRLQNLPGNHVRLIYDNPLYSCLQVERKSLKIIGRCEVIVKNAKNV